MRFLLTLFACFAATQALAQQPARDTNAEQSFTLRQQVRNVVVDVVVTDKHGDPVAGLDQSAFQLFENGAPQQIALFDRHTPDEAGSEAKVMAAALPPLPPNLHTNARPQQPAGPMVVLLLDAMNTPMQAQSMVRNEAIDYLKKLPANTHMAIFVLGNDLRMIQNFTTDPAILRAALDGRAYPTGVARVEVGEASYQPTTAGLASAPIGMGEAISSIRASLEHFGNSGDMAQEMRLRYSLDALSALSIYLGGIAGHKNLIWFTGSVPWTINPDFSLVVATTGRADYTSELKRLADQMTEARVAIYPVDASMLPSPGMYAANMSGDITGRGTFGANGGSSVPHGATLASGYANSDLAEQMNQAGAHMSMQNLAHATGGRAFYNSNDLAGVVARVNDLGQTYYSLVYSPTDKRLDAGFRHIEVKLNNPALKLEYRRGYYAEDPRKAAPHEQLVTSSPLRVLMQHGGPDVTQVLFKLENRIATVQPDPASPASRVGAQAASLSGPLTRVEFHWNVDLGTVAFRDVAGQHQGELDAALTAYDAQGKVINSLYSTLPLSLSEAQWDRLKSSGLPMKQALDLPPGTVWLRAAVMDPSAGHAGVTEFKMVVEKP